MYGGLKGATKPIRSLPTHSGMAPTVASLLLPLTPSIVEHGAVSTCQLGRTLIHRGTPVNIGACSGSTRLAVPASKVHMHLAVYISFMMPLALPAAVGADWKSIRPFVKGIAAPALKG